MSKTRLAAMILAIGTLAYFGTLVYFGFRSVLGV